MSRTNGRRTDKSSYSNPKSKARSRKEHSKKIANMQYQSSSKQMNKKSASDEHKKVKVKMSSIYGKVCKPIMPEANTIITTNHFDDLYIEIPVVMKWYHRLSKKSSQLIVNFLKSNPWALLIFYQKYNEHFEEDFENMLKSIIKHNFNHGKFFSKDLSARDIFFHQKIFSNGKKEWVFMMNIADLYDSYATYCKRKNGNIPYFIRINHLIYKNTDNKKEKNVGNYDNIYTRFAFTIVNNNEHIIKPIPDNLGVNYILYINNKNKRKAMDKNHDYIEHQFNKVVIKEIPLISTPVSTKRK